MNGLNILKLMFHTYCKTVAKDLAHLSVYGGFVCLGFFFMLRKLKRKMSELIGDSPRKSMDIDIEHEDGTTTNWIDDENPPAKKKISVKKKKHLAPPDVSLDEVKEIERELAVATKPKKEKAVEPKFSIDEQFYALNLKLQQFYNLHPEQCKYTKDELIAMQPTKKNLQALSFAYQSYCLADNTAFTQMLGKTALNLSAMPVGGLLGCAEELTEELNNDKLLQQKLQDLAFSGVSRNELPPALVIATLYANDLVKAKAKATAKRELEKPVPKLEDASSSTAD